MLAVIYEFDFANWEGDDVRCGQYKNWKGPSFSFLAMGDDVAFILLLLRLVCSSFRERVCI
jgi:hypothetical protein